MTSRAMLLRIAAVVLAVGTLAGVPAQPARANGVPLLVPLSYVSGLSNWGPNEASGTLELALGEGYAKVNAAGLPLVAGQRYQGWLVNSQSNDAISIGTFNPTPAGAVTYKGTLPAAVNFGFDLFIITVEPEPDDAPQPTEQRSIGGRFSLIGQRPADGAPAGEVQMLSGGAGPRQLPNTGDNTLQSDLLRVGLLLAASAAALLVGMRLGRNHA